MHCHIWQKNGSLSVRKQIMATDVASLKFLLFCEFYIVRSPQKNLTKKIKQQHKNLQVPAWISNESKNKISYLSMIIIENSGKRYKC